MAKKGRLYDRLVMIDGQNAIKSINVNDPDDHPEAWTWISGGPRDGNAKAIADYFATVPWLRRGVNIVASSVAGLPFTISKLGGDEELDNSEDYKNVVKFLPDPKRLFWLMVASRQLTGQSYLWKSRNKVITLGLKYLNPTSVTPRYSEDEKNAGELIGFKRKYSTGTKGVDERDVELEDILYSWVADPYTEMGPPKNYPAKSALSASGVM